MGDVVMTVADEVATITIDRPSRHNALSPDALVGLGDAFVRARDDDGIRVVVLTGAGERAFCAGADLTGFDSMSAVEQHEARGWLPALFSIVDRLGKPTIAKVRGYALAGGFGLALMCDLVVAADDAVFGAPEIDVGMWPMVITVPMLRSMPPKLALELQMTGRRVTAREAERYGFVTTVVEPAALDAAVDALARELAGKPGAIMRLGRNAFYKALDLPADDALAMLHASVGLVCQTEDHREGTAAFAEKRTPRWTHR